MDIAGDHPTVLDELEPLALIQNFEDSAWELLYAVWRVNEDFFTCKKTLREIIKERSDAAGIEIRFAHRSVYAGSEGAPSPVRIASETETSVSVPSVS